MNRSVTPTEMLKLVRSPESLACMKRSISGWSQRSTPICAPRLGLDCRERPRDTGADRPGALLAVLGVLLEQHVARDRLLGQALEGARRGGRLGGLCHDESSVVRLRRMG